MWRVVRPLRLRPRRGAGSEYPDSAFGKLETRVLEALWRRGQASVRDLQDDVPDVAYTTLMTTADRLHRKGVLDRVKTGRAFLYSPRSTREELQSGLAADALSLILGRDASSRRPILSLFLEALSRRDRRVLDELEQLVRERRRQRGEDR
jgi:predicted transcriptional regulator